MTPERWQQIEAIFQTAVERTMAGRQAFVLEACGGDDELRGEVESLLAHEVAATFLEAPIKGAARSLTSRVDDARVGQRIGVYRVISLIGHGGMGAVYRAVRDDDQYQKQVALKLVKRGMDSAEILERFRSERQILASLEHAHIARLLDGGTTADDLPYLVMECIEGEAITDYCEKRQLSITERLKLFLQVCAAVAYAHQKLVVHRDLKPSNILVTQEGELKLLDFGIAKFLAPDLSLEAAPQTATELRLMTPDYASPEQVRGLPITTATDIYSLGAVLYELLTGERPHRLKNYSPSEIERAICGAETEKPSAAVNRATTAPAKQRKQNGKQLSGDLDNIVLMAMRKEPERRYSSVEQFAEDIRRHLEGRPVIARQDTLGYRASKFVQRHKLSLAATALVILSLAGGIVMATYQARRAERRFQEVRKLANTFLFDFHDKIQDLTGATEAREMLVKTALEYLDSLAKEAEGDAALQMELARAYLKVGDLQGNPRGPNLAHPEAALVSYRQALALAQKVIARNSDDLNAQRVLGLSYFKVGDRQAESGDLAGGAEILRQGLRIAEPLAQRTGEEQDLVTYINCHTFIGSALLYAGDPASALAEYRRARPLIEMRLAKFPSDMAHSHLAASHNRVGETLLSLGDPVGALESFRYSTPIYERLSRKNPSNSFFRRELIVVYGWLGGILGDPNYINLGDEAAALRYYRQSLAVAEELAAADRKNMNARYELANRYAKIGDLLAVSDPAQSAENYRQALTLHHDVLASSPTSPRYLRYQSDLLRSLANPLLRLGDHQGALQNLRQSLEILQPLIAKNPTSAQLRGGRRATVQAMGDVFLKLGDHSSALEHYRQAITLAEASVAAKPTELYARWRLADCYASLGRYYAALAVHLQTSSADRLANWREARAWHQKSLDIWDRWTQQAVSSVFNTTHRDQAARALAECDTALARLSVTAQR